MLMVKEHIILEGRAKTKSALLTLHLKLSLPPSRNGQINSSLCSSNSVRHLSVSGCSTLQDDKSGNDIWEDLTNFFLFSPIIRHMSPQVLG